MIKACVGPYIVLTGSGLDFEMLKGRMKKNLTWLNPEYAKKEQMGKWVGATPRFLTLVQEIGKDTIIIPFGLLTTLFADYPGQIEYFPDYHISRQKDVLSAVKVEDMGLYPYQETAVRWALKARNGIIVAPCGSGKTQMGLSICGALGYRCLWLTHTHELLKQSMNRAMAVLPIGKDSIGTITDGKVNVGSFITFATVQTMAKIDLEPLREVWDVIIVDECHKAVGTPTRMTMFWKVISGLSARYKYGLTATPKRGDGMQKAMFALLGQGYYIDRAQVKDTTCPLGVEVVKTGWEPDFDEQIFNPDGTLNYVRLVTECVEDESRNEIIANDVNDWMDGPVMVLSERVHHLELLAQKCTRPYAIMSTAKKSEREHLLNDMKDGKIEVLFATYQLAKEGLDIPCLRHLVMASPVKDEITVAQSAGRVMRKYPGKEVGIVWDFVDGMRMLQNWHNKRMRVYRRLQDERCE